MCDDFVQFSNKDLLRIQVSNVWRFCESYINFELIQLYH